MPRQYAMEARREAMRRTRESILDAAFGRFADADYDEVTLGQVAAAAGVSQQTVLNHFGDKMGLYLTGVTERWAPLIERARSSMVPGDLGSVIAAVVADYEQTGDSTMRTQAVARRHPELRDMLAVGRRWHRAWVARAAGPLVADRDREDREQTLYLLSLILDVSTWHQMRRLDDLDVATTSQRLVSLARAVLSEQGPAAPPPG